MSDQLEMDFRNYHFLIIDWQGNSIRIEVKGKNRYLLQLYNFKEIEKIIKNMGKWEKMLISIMNLNKDLNIFPKNVEKEIEEFVIDNFYINTDFEGDSLSTPNAIYSFIEPANPDIKISKEKILNHLKNSIKWKLLFETVSNFHYEEN